MSNATLFNLEDGSAQENLLDAALAKQLAEKLHATYPGHLWAVNVDHRAGMIDIRNLYLAGNWGYRLRMGKVYSASSLERDAMRAGGEILERFRLQRSSFDQDAWSSAPVDISGRLLFDKS